MSAYGRLHRAASTSGRTDRPIRADHHGGRPCAEPARLRHALFRAPRKAGGRGQPCRIRERVRTADARSPFDAACPRLSCRDGSAEGDASRWRRVSRVPSAASASGRCRPAGCNGRVGGWPRARRRLGPCSSGKAGIHRFRAIGRGPAGSGMIAETKRRDAIGPLRASYPQHIALRNPRHGARRPAKTATAA